MGANVGKSQNNVSYGMPRRRKTVSNDNGNYFSKDYWENAQQRSTMGPKYWMIDFEKQYRDQVFKKKPENVYSKSNALYRRMPRSFDSPFSQSTSNSHAGSMTDRNSSSSANGSRQLMHSDLPLNPTPLLELCAAVVAHDDGALLKEKNTMNEPKELFNSLDTETQLSSNFSHMAASVSSSETIGDGAEEISGIALAAPCAEMIFNNIVARFRDIGEPETLEGEENTAAQSAESRKIELRSAVLPFVNGISYPITNLDLSGLCLEDTLLARLLAAQQQNLVMLNLSAVKNVTASGVCSWLAQRKARFRRARSLKFTTADLLRVSRLRRHGSSRKRSLLSSDDDSQPLEAGDASLSVTASSPTHFTGAATETAPDFMSFFPYVEHLHFPQGLHYDIEDEQHGAFLNRCFDAIQPALVRTLDLSEWQNKIAFIKPLSRLQGLTTLILYDVHNLDNSIDIIREIRTIVVLDLSQSDRLTGQYKRPVTALNSLATHLTRLAYLDISGTNLHSNCTYQDLPFRGVGRLLSDIPGLRNIQRPLKFLGIFNCDHASHYENLPAEQVSGDHGEDQLLLALDTYMERARMMHLVLNESYQLYRYVPGKRYNDALHLVIRALELHRTNSSIQIAGSALLFYIIRNVQMNHLTKRKIVKLLIDGMDAHGDEQVMVRNCCLSLCQLEIPADVMFEYLRVAELLIRVLRTHQTDALAQRIIVFLMNSMACHVEGDLKLQLVLNQIQRKYAANMCDDVMEVCWSFLWNITDETLANCERFLRADGLDLFRKCYSQFPNETEVLRNMMGLIGNIAEVESLREQLMDKSFVNIFRRLLTTLTDGIEISYNTAGVLAHMVSDGDTIWSQNLDIPRADVMNDIILATSKWNLEAKRSINYRSFNPILKLLPLHHSVGSQHWAAWALANLTCTDPDKYCPYVADGENDRLLHWVYAHKETVARVRELVGIVLRNVKEWRHGGDTLMTQEPQQRDDSMSEIEMVD